ncbi:MAG: acyltransferase [Tatlockia sp.]|nr:acyltransferase [Tatlockia sp.]
MIYRPHVDGLRAIAVIFVLIFHAGLNLFPSGFIGVDIFFVISGFLITGLILNSLQNNKFSFIEFYNRRLWRLQPVLLCLFLVCFIFTLIYFLPEDLLIFSKSARKSAVFIGNQYFEKITSGYFSKNVNFFPLLHTWSLAIEWQCYLILPLALFLLHRFVGEKHLAKVTYLLTLGFFLLALHYSSITPVETYYQLLSRIFEFLIGSCVALRPKPLALNRFNLNLLAVAAFFTLFYIARLQGINLGFPNYYALILCLATATLIAVGESEKKPICIQVLSLKPIVFIGLLSYSLYIWHWPVFVLIRYFDIKETAEVTLFAFCIISIIAYLSWRFIEKPSRKMSKLSFGYSLSLLFILPFLALYASDYQVKKFEGFPQRLQENEKIYTLLKKYSAQKRFSCLVSCLQKEALPVDTNCTIGTKNPSSRKGFMFGDSYSNHHWQFMDFLGKSANLSILAHSTAGCLTLSGLMQYDVLAKDIYKICKEQNEIYYKMVKENHYDYVIIAQTWDDYLFVPILNKPDDERSIELVKARIEKALDKSLELIIDSGATPVLIKAIAKPLTNSYDCFFGPIKRREKFELGHCDFNLDRKKMAWFNELFAKMQKKYAQLIIIDPRKVQCKSGLCKADINGIPVFSDATHINDYASYKFAKTYVKRYKNPLLS